MSDLSTVFAKAKAATNERFIDWIVRPERVRQTVLIMIVLLVAYMIFFIDVEVQLRKEARDIRPYIQPKFISIALAVVIVLLSLFSFIKVARQ